MLIYDKQLIHHTNLRPLCSGSSYQELAFPDILYPRCSTQGIKFKLNENFPPKTSLLRPHATGMREQNAGRSDWKKKTQHSRSLDDMELITTIIA